ncbi:MAG: aldehyde dehydrogenase family protein [Pseudoxanthomonas sp.]
MNSVPLPLQAHDDNAQVDRPSLQRIFDAQGGTALRLRSSTYRERLAKLEQLRRAVLAHRHEIVAAGAADFRKPEAEVEMSEILPVILEIADARKHLKRWMKPRKVRPTAMTLGTSSHIHYEPRGRCLIIAPWNYPVTLTLGPLVPALAAGNAIMVKTSEMAPNLSAVLKKLLRSAFAEDEVAVFEGGPEVAIDLLDLPFDHIFFTGSPTIGKQVMAAAARHLASVTLELGGKSPTIVDASANLEQAAKTIAWGKFANSGQTCIAPDHVYVHASVQDRFVELLRRAIVNAYGEGDALRSAPLTGIVNHRHVRRVIGLMEDARQRGARLLHGGESDETNRFVSPTLLTGIPSDARIMHEEIFGPLLPILPFERVDAVIEQINASPKPLAMYVWSNNQANIDALLTHTSAGGTCINHVMMQFLHHNLPFGGVNNSGIGNYHGEYGFRAFSHERAVLRSRVLVAKAFFPPATAWKRRAVDWLIRHS